mmetsp:Transcript_86090/g.238548  ORF Transcript_86090/g.238548 Transcript_86090/m.238548 type:complete len:263 (+) Transcript_86090:963-1751(+)
MSRSAATCFGMSTKATSGTSSGLCGARTGQLTSPIDTAPSETLAPSNGAVSTGARCCRDCCWLLAFCCPIAGVADSLGALFPAASSSKRAAVSREAGGRNRRHAEKARSSAPAMSPGRHFRCAAMRKSRRRLSCIGARLASPAAAFRISLAYLKSPPKSCGLWLPRPTNVSCSSLGSGCTAWKWKRVATSSSIHGSPKEPPTPGGSPHAMQRKAGWTGRTPRSASASASCSSSNAAHRRGETKREPSGNEASRSASNGPSVE